jgi:hypothetical protein
MWCAIPVFAVLEALLLIDSSIISDGRSDDTASSILSSKRLSVGEDILSSSECQSSCDGVADSIR